MAYEITSPEIFPQAIGNEEESMILIGTSPTDYQQPEDFMHTLEYYAGRQVKHSGSPRLFLQNGGMIYEGGHIDGSGGNLERTTPECVTPSQAAAYIEANENLTIAMLTNYLTDVPDEVDPRFVRWHRRVIDAQGTTKACHDNFDLGFSWGQRDGLWERKAILGAHLASRSFITGAGMMANYHYATAQKAATVDYLNTYGYLSSAYRVATEDDTGPRLEVRCNDINISPWAIQVRLGSVCLLLASMQTELFNDMYAIAPAILNDGDIVGRIRNSTDITVDDTTKKISLGMYGNQMIDFQERAATLYAEHLPHYADVPENLMLIAHEIIEYCQDFRKVEAGLADVSLLADRSDMAAKLHIILSGITKDRDDGIERYLGDVRSQQQDMQYDQIRIVPPAFSKVGTKTKVTYGSGYRLRQKGRFRLTPKPSAVEAAFYRPPTETRAYSRGEIVRRGVAAVNSWAYVSLKSFENDATHTKVYSLGRVRDNAKGSTLVDNLAAQHQQ